MQLVRIKNNVVREVVSDTTGYDKDFIASLVEALDDVLPGWTYDGESFSAPTVSTNPLTTSEFAALFEDDELPALFAAASANAAAARSLAMLFTGNVVAREDVETLLPQIVLAGILTQERADKILKQVT